MLKTTLSCLLFLILTMTIVADKGVRLTPEPLLNPATERTAASHLNVAAAEQEVINRTNSYRASLGLGPLTAKSCLSLAARRHSQDMGDRAYFSHTAPAPAPYGTTFSERAANAGYTGFAMGENIAAGYNSALSAFTAWRSSAGHAANMANAQANEIGVGLAQVAGSPYTYYWTMTVGKSSGGSCPVNHLATDLSVTGNIDTHPARPTFTWTHNTDVSDPHKIVPQQYRVLVFKNGTTYMNVLSDVAAVCSGSACSYTPDEVVLPNGLQQREYELWIGSFSATGETVWAGPEPFTVLSGPDDVVMISPAAGSTVESSAIFPLTWAHDGIATWYHIYLAGPNGYVFDQWVENRQGLCTTECTTFVAPLYNGEYRWWMTGWSPAGYSLSYTNQTFTLNVNTNPGAVTGLDYYDNQGAGGPSQNFKWSHDNKASWYELIIIREDNNNAQVHKQWYAGVDICITGCRISGLTLVNGTYIFKMRAWGPGGIGNQTQIANQMVNWDPPGIIAGHNPDGKTLVNGNNLELQWSKDPYSTWYYVSLTRSGVVVVQGWYEARKLCNSSSVCYLDPLNLTPGTYQWQMMNWGPAGIGPTQATINFTVQ